MRSRLATTTIGLVTALLIVLPHTLFSQDPPEYRTHPPPLPLRLGAIRAYDTGEGQPLIAHANAILLDPQRNLFAVNAHLIAAGKEFMIGFPYEQYRAMTKSSWINWTADIGLVQLADTPPFAWPAPELLAALPNVGAPLTLQGYLPQFIDPYGKVTYAPYSLEGTVVGIGSRVDLAPWEKEQFLHTTPKETHFWLYRTYLIFEANPGQEEKPTLQFGMSGSEARTADGKTAGILAYIAHPKAYLAPSIEILALHKKITAQLQKSRHKK